MCLTVLFDFTNITKEIQMIISGLMSNELLSFQFLVLETLSDSFWHVQYRKETVYSKKKSVPLRKEIISNTAFNF